MYCHQQGGKLDRQLGWFLTDHSQNMWWVDFDFGPIPMSMALIPVGKEHSLTISGNVSVSSLNRFPDAILRRDSMTA